MKIRICPKCHSPDIVQDISRGMEHLAGIGKTYTCKKCGFVGMIFPEVENDSKILGKK